MEDVVSLHFIAYSRFPRIFHHFFGLLSNDAITRAQQRLNLGHFFFSCPLSQGISLSNIEIGFQRRLSEGRERSRNQPHLHCSFHVAPQKTIEKRLFLAREEYFPGKQKISFFQKSSYSHFSV